MKNIKLIVLLILSCIVACSCKSKNDVFSAPEKVVEQYEIAFCTGDFDNMYKYTVPKNAAIIKGLQRAMKQNQAQLDKVRANNVEVKSVVCTMQNDSVAFCECKYVLNGADRTSIIDVNKIDGKWLVNMAIN